MVKGVINCEMKKFPLEFKLKGDVNKVNVFFSFNKPVSLESNELVYSNTYKIVLPVEYQRKILDPKTSLKFLIQSYASKSLTIKVTFKGIFNTNASESISKYQLENLYDYNKYYQMKLWIPDRLKQKMDCYRNKKKRARIMERMGIVDKVDFNKSNIHSCRLDNLKLKI